MQSKAKTFQSLIVSLLLVLIFNVGLSAQTIQYNISFENAELHEAEIEITFTQVPEKVLEVRMPRSSPGRYAIHEFAKNVYNFEAMDENGNALEVYRPNPYQWDVAGHNGTVKVKYTLFANRADGTYSGIDARQAHLNMPATFMFARGLEFRPIEIIFDVREDLNWKVATQLQPLGGNKFAAPNMQYFLDSPTMVSNWTIREWDVNGQTIRFVLLHVGTDAEVDAYAEQVKAIVLEQEAIFGELPKFDFGTYTFLASYNPWVSGDGMEHRNSTILTGGRSLAAGGNIGTVSHEFFHAWNVERIRPKSLEPFSFEEANMSGELWFAEGFTSYYTPLAMVRAGLINPNQYVNGLVGGINAVINSPGPKIHSVVEMSYQAPFVDAATSIDPVNRANTFVSYYTYGSVLGLALDLEIRQRFTGKDLDGYMTAMWQRFGKPEIPYTLQGLRDVLADFTGDRQFADNFYDQYIHGKNIPDFAVLLKGAGIEMKKANPGRAILGPTFVRFQDGKATVASDVIMGSPLYEAKISRGDVLISVDGVAIVNDASLGNILGAKKPGDKVEIVYNQMGMEKKATVALMEDPAMSLQIVDENNALLQNWLKSKVK
jgi:predicted metalloprotease with PDZ domain